MKTTPDLQKLAAEIRYQVILMAKRGSAAHLGSSLSCVDLIAAAYWNYLNINPNDPQNRLRDRFILSKGHAITALYGCLAEKGFFPKKLLETFNQDGSLLPEHPSPQCVPGVEMATGSLGHGLSVGLGQALAGKILKEPYQVMVLLSDGECNEGAVWEAALFAPAHQVSHLIVVVDYNKWQATGRSDEVMQLTPLKDKWESFGWQALEIDGNNIEEILAAYSEISSEKPTAIIAHTVKGKGVSFMEDNNNWHYRIPSDDEIAKAKKELKV